MKKNIFLTTVLLLGMSLSAQKTVNLKINHKLGSSAFAFGQKSTNDIGQDFNLKRCEYYLSKISIVHDGGKVTQAKDVYALVKASATTSIDLGSYNITTVESINFSVGVDPGVNNADPTKWPSTHPLAPKNPSMHWGWSAGYRFAAIEGKSGTNLTTLWEIHALGNKNYFDINIPTSATDNNGDLDITLNADYSEALSNLKVDEGFFSHGEDDEAYIALRNFQNKVFTSTDGKTNTLANEEIELATKVNVFPNPSDGELTVSLEKAMDADVKIFDLSGRLVQSKTLANESSIKIEGLETGIYILKLQASDETLHTERIIVN